MPGENLLESKIYCGNFSDSAHGKSVQGKICPGHGFRWICVRTDLNLPGAFFALQYDAQQLVRRILRTVSATATAARTLATREESRIYCWYEGWLCVMFVRVRVCVYWVVRTMYPVRECSDRGDRYVQSACVCVNMIGVCKLRRRLGTVTRLPIQCRAHRAHMLPKKGCPLRIDILLCADVRAPEGQSPLSCTKDPSRAADRTSAPGSRR